MTSWKWLRNIIFSALWERGLSCWRSHVIWSRK